MLNLMRNRSLSCLLQSDIDRKSCCSFVMEKKCLCYYKAQIWERIETISMR